MAKRVVSEKVEVKTLKEVRLDGNTIMAGVIVEIDPELVPIWTNGGLATTDLSEEVDPPVDTTVNETKTPGGTGVAVDDGTKIPEGTGVGADDGTKTPEGGGN